MPKNTAERAGLQPASRAAPPGDRLRRWRKLHLAVDAGTGEIAAHVLTEGHADDAAQVPILLGQVEGVIASITADGAYDGEPTYAAAAARQRHPPPDVVVPPRASAVPSSDKGDSGAQSQRDRHIQLVEPGGSPGMAERGRMGWQKATGYGRRNQAERWSVCKRQVLPDTMGAAVAVLAPWVASG